MINSLEAARILLVWTAIGLLAGFTYGVWYERYWSGHTTYCIAEPGKPVVCETMADGEAEQLKKELWEK